MTSLKIDFVMLKRFIKDFRETFESQAEDGLFERSEYREYLAIEVRNNRHLWRAAQPRTADDLRDELHNAAMRAGLFGATQSQIALIMKLARAADDFTGLGSGRLTRAEASLIISSKMRGA